MITKIHEFSPWSSTVQSSSSSSDEHTGVFPGGSEVGRGPGPLWIWYVELEVPGGARMVGGGGTAGL